MTRHHDNTTPRQISQSAGLQQKPPPVKDFTTSYLDGKSLNIEHILKSSQGFHLYEELQDFVNSV